MSYDKYPGFFRVSEVADAVGRLESDGLMHVGATWSSQRAIEISDELMSGVLSPEIAHWLVKNEDREAIDYLKSQNYGYAIKAGATRKQQAAADRGTVLNLVWDALNRKEFIKVRDAVDFAIHEMEARSILAKLSNQEYQESIQLGLVDPKDKDKKPVRNYQCSIDEIVPFVTSLAKWYPTAAWKSVESQKFLVDEKSKVMGTLDDNGYWGDQKVLTDLKSATSPQPKLYNVCQVAKYWQMDGADRSVRPMNIIVTVEGVYPRLLSDQGIKIGLAHFDAALSILKAKSMRGLFLTTAESAVKSA